MTGIHSARRATPHSRMPAAPTLGGRRMIDPDEREQAALRAALRNMAELMAEIGWTTRFADLSEAQALALATATVDGFQEAMATSAPRPDPEVPF